MEIRKIFLTKMAKFALKHNKEVWKAFKKVPKPVKTKIIKYGAKKVGKSAMKKIVATAIPISIENSIAWVVKKGKRNIVKK